MSSLDSLHAELDKYSDPIRAVQSQRFFKTGKGEYGEGDVFVGITMPDLRRICKSYRDISTDDLQVLLNSKIHEHRMAAVVIMSDITKNNPRKDLYDLYLKNVLSNRINNWDLIDVSAKYVVGNYLLGKEKNILYELANSNHLWSKRVAVLSTFGHLDSEYTDDAMKLADILLYDNHDLIQKAVGWMLREIGKRVDQKLLLGFLDEHASTMPRTTLRYAIEHLTNQQKQYYMNLKNI
jgi:3-methyladenine DNA glycosylase AlkD